MLSFRPAWIDRQRIYIFVRRFIHIFFSNCIFRKYLMPLSFLGHRGLFLQRMPRLASQFEFFEVCGQYPIQLVSRIKYEYL